MSSFDNVVDLAERAAREILDGYRAATANTRAPYDRFEIHVPSIAGQNVAALDRESGVPTLHDHIAFAGARLLPYDFSTGRILQGIGFELESHDGVYTGKAYVWGRDTGDGGG